MFKERLRSIAKATLQLASDEGPGSVTVRAVAARLGGSTTLITKYLPTRLALLGNAFAYVDENWEIDKAKALEGKAGMERVRALAHWSLQTENYDDAIRRFWMEALAGSPTKADHEAPKDEAHDEYDAIREAVDDAGQQPWLADLLFLAFRGYYISSVEDPATWSPERAFAAVQAALDLVEAPGND